MMVHVLWLLHAPYCLCCVYILCNNIWCYDMYACDIHYVMLMKWITMYVMLCITMYSYVMDHVMTVMYSWCIYVQCHRWKEKRNDVNEWKSWGRHACMYICHVHRDTSPLCYVSTDAYFRYLCPPWYHADLSFYESSAWRIIRCVWPSQAQG